MTSGYIFMSSAGTNLGNASCFPALSRHLLMSTVPLPMMTRLSLGRADSCAALPHWAKQTSRHRHDATARDAAKLSAFEQHISNNTVHELAHYLLPQTQMSKPQGGAALPAFCCKDRSQQTILAQLKAVLDEWKVTKLHVPRELEVHLWPRLQHSQDNPRLWK